MNPRPSTVVRRDEIGVAGFFEDLPILVFVLAGTSIIVLSTLSVSAELASIEKNSELSQIADRCVELLLRDLVGHSEVQSSTVGAICATRLCQIAAEFLEGGPYSIGIVMIHPTMNWLVQSTSSGSTIPCCASTASRLFNALTDDGLSAILVVRIVVWQ